MKLNENRSKGSGHMKQTLIEGKIPCPLYATLNLRLCNQVIRSAHHPTNRNILVKFYVNLLNGFADIERTQNSRVNPMTLNCDLDLGPR